jgi:hypothetical protein
VSDNDLLDLNDQFLRRLAVALLEAIPNGDPIQNVAAIASFNTNLMAGLIFSGASTKEQAMDGIEAYAADLRKLIGENFDAAKKAMEKADQEKEDTTH